MSTAAVMAEAKTRTQAIRVAKRHPANTNAIAMMAARASTKLAHGPRLSVNSIPSSWTASTKDHKEDFHQKL